MTHKMERLKNCNPKWSKDAFFANILRDEKAFMRIKDLGSEVQYRCLACRNCRACRKGGSLEAISLQEEKEQALIESSLQYDANKKALYGKLPFINDPVTHLSQNQHLAAKIFESQMKLLEKDPGSQDEILASHSKLVDHGYSIKEADLPKEVADKIDTIGGSGYYMP